MFDVCKIHKETNPDQQVWIYLIIVIEVILIVVIVAKVWYDQIQYRRTGKLPWLSQNSLCHLCDVTHAYLQLLYRLAVNVYNFISTKAASLKCIFCWCDHS